MRDLAAILRGELKNLESELAKDPRVQKARKIRELLAMYEPSCTALEPNRASAIVDVLAGPAGKNQYSMIGRMRLVVRKFWLSQDTAAVARSRLVEMARTNCWPDTRSTWLQLQTSPADQIASLEDVPPPEPGGFSHKRTPLSGRISNRKLGVGPTTTGEMAHHCTEAVSARQKVVEREA